MIKNEVVINEALLLELGWIHQYVDRDHVFLTKGAYKAYLYKNKIIISVIIGFHIYKVEFELYQVKEFIAFINNDKE